MQDRKKELIILAQKTADSFFQESSGEVSTNVIRAIAEQIQRRGWDSVKNIKKEQISRIRSKEYGEEWENTITLIRRLLKELLNKEELILFLGYFYRELKYRLSVNNDETNDDTNNFPYKQSTQNESEEKTKNKQVTDDDLRRLMQKFNKK